MSLIVRVRSVPQTFWRCKRQFTSEFQEFPLDAFTAEELEILQNDGNIVCQIVDTEADTSVTSRLVKKLEGRIDRLQKVNTTLRSELAKTNAEYEVVCKQLEAMEMTATKSANTRKARQQKKSS